MSETTMTTPAAVTSPADVVAIAQRHGAGPGGWPVEPADADRSPVVVDAELMLAGALLWASPAQVSAALVDVVEDDIEDPYLSELVETARTLAVEGLAGPVPVKDRLFALGRLAGDGRGAVLHRRLIDATETGARPVFLCGYVVAVVAQAYWRRFEALMAGIGGLAGQPERVWWPYLREHGRAIAEHEQRLARLRGAGGLL